MIGSIKKGAQNDMRSPTVYQTNWITSSTQAIPIMHSFIGSLSDRTPSTASNATLPPSYISLAGGDVPRNERVSSNVPLTPTCRIDRDRNQPSSTTNVPSLPPSHVSNIGGDRHERVSDWRSGI
jgi:hypothetical protein